MLKTKNKKCSTKENEYVKQRVNSFLNESFKLIKIINSYHYLRRFCYVISHV